MSYTFVNLVIKIALILFQLRKKTIFFLLRQMGGRWKFMCLLLSCVWQVTQITSKSKCLHCRKGLWWFQSTRCEVVFWVLILSSTLKCCSSSSWEEIPGINLINCTKSCFLSRCVPCNLTCLWYMSLACGCCLFHLEIARQGNEKWHVSNCVGFKPFLKKRGGCMTGSTGLSVNGRC